MKKCKINIKNKEYTLGLNRDSIKWLEANNFSLEEFDRKPVTFYDLLWNSLFLMNHKDVNPNLAIKLLETYEKEKGKAMVTEVIKFAISEFSAFMYALADIDSEKKETLEIIED